MEERGGDGGWPCGAFRGGLNCPERTDGKERSNGLRAMIPWCFS